MHGFQNDWAQLLSLRSRSAIRSICLGGLKVKVTFEGQMVKWSSGHYLYIYGFQNNLAQFSFETFV